MSFTNIFPSTAAVMVMPPAAVPCAVELFGKFTLIPGSTENVVDTRKKRMSWNTTSIIGVKSTFACTTSRLVTFIMCSLQTFAREFEEHFGYVRFHFGNTMVH